MTVEDFDCVTELVSPMTYTPKEVVGKRKCARKQSRRWILESENIV